MNKSIFGAGHMRFHPDDRVRVLAAATGLIDSATTSSSSEGPAGLIDLARTLGGRSWSKTDKRGRQVTSTATTARSRSRTSKCTTSASEGGGGGGGGGGGDESLLLMSDENRFKCRACNKSFQSHQALGGHMASHNKLMMKQKQQINRAIAILPKHICNICDKSFPTGQALGGHKRRHWTPPAVVIDQPSSNNYNYNYTSAASSSTACPPTCSTAATQLQLGLASSAGSLVINEEVEAAASGSKVLDFDLNELPPGSGGDEGMESC